MQGGRFLYPALFKTLFLPPFLTYVLIYHLPLPSPFPALPRLLGLLLRTSIFILSFPLLFILRSHVSLARSTVNARALGAIDIPRVKGRWPLNLDVLVDWATSGSEEEVGRMLVLLKRKYGETYNTRVLGEDQIISTDPAVFKHALIDDFGNFVKGQKFKDRAEAFLGDGIFNSDGERWKFHRTLMRPFFHPSHISPQLFTPLIARFLEELPPSGKPFDIQARLGQLALEMAIMWVCGEDMHPEADMGSSGEENEWKESRKEFGRAMTEAQKAVGKRVKIGTVWPLLELMHDPLADPMRIIRTFFAPIISRALERKRERRELKEAVDVQFIDRLVDATDDLKLIEDQLINVLLASRDTLASCLTFCIYALVLHPEVESKLRQEVLRVAGDGGPVTKDIIRELRYCKAFINEVLRLFPPVPLNIRRTLRPSLLPTADAPMYMPGDTSIILAFVVMQRDPAVWGDDADLFVPERWMGSGLGSKEREGFMSWNVGPRMCLGQPFALMVTNTFLVLLARHFAKTQGDAKKTMGLHLAMDAQPEGTVMPEAWLSAEGSDGRARGGRDRLWVVADVVLAIKGGLWVMFRHQD